jgi:hypothetical protein
MKTHNEHRKLIKTKQLHDLQENKHRAKTTITNHMDTSHLPIFINYRKPCHIVLLAIDYIAPTK